MIGTSFSYTGNFVFYGLTPSTQYEVIIQSRNREGWSDATDIFRFNTRSQGKLRVLEIKMLTNQYQNSHLFLFKFILFFHLFQTTTRWSSRTNIRGIFQDQADPFCLRRH